MPTFNAARVVQKSMGMTGGSFKTREFFELKACDVIMYDLTWCGGLSLARKVAAGAEAFARLIATEHADFGEIVFNLIEANLMSKTDHDDRADFANVFDLDEALVEGYEIEVLEIEQEHEIRNGTTVVLYPGDD